MVATDAHMVCTDVERAGIGEETTMLATFAE
jgi:hypothetical protein